MHHELDQMGRPADGWAANLPLNLRIIRVISSIESVSKAISISTVVFFIDLN